MRTERPGTGHLNASSFNANTKNFSAAESLARRTGGSGSVKVRQGPDGLLYLLTDGEDGAMLRIEPVLSSPSR